MCAEQKKEKANVELSHRKTTTRLEISWEGVGRHLVHMLPILI